MKENDLNKYLIETEYCNFTDHSIQSLANTFKKRYPHNKEGLIEAIFYWVRDSIHYRIGLWNKLASETLQERSGSCTNKANLLVALFRACGIPSAYCVLRIRGESLFGEVVLPEFVDKISENTIHVFVQIFVNDKWIKCDPSADVFLADKTNHLDTRNNLLDLDIVSGSVLNFKENSIIDEKCLLYNIDHIISKKPETGKGFVVEIGNLYISFLRSNGRQIKNKDEIRPLFKKWLKKNSKKHHFLYSMQGLLNQFMPKIKK
ncbi:MAG: transglutaminase-like domain-containing protein [Candidatus Taylorbacteria bacterium]